ncbi:hypothetical protein D3C85_672430 [compost metagenome]
MGWFLLFMTVVISGIGYGIGGQAGGTVAISICIIILIVWTIYAMWHKPGTDYIKDEE